MIKGFTPRNNLHLLAELTIYVPNRRAARALASCFLDASERRATLLPKIRMLGDVDDDEFDLETSIEISDALPQSINPLERKIELAKLIQTWVTSMSKEALAFYGDKDIAIPSSQSDALYLADDLCVLLGQITQEEINWKTIQEIVPDDHAEWWRLTTTFLKIIMENWPEYLAEQGQVDPAEKTALQLKMRADIFETKGSKGPVIIAGSTGSVRSTQYLLKAVSGLPNGAVVLPGLDLEMPENEWKTLYEDKLSTFTNPETHPQFGLARLLDVLLTHRKNVVALGTLSKEKYLRQALISTALSSSEATANWSETAKRFNDHDISQALSGITYINASNERQEATAIATAMQEVLTKPGKTAALVTPDRNLASRVTMELQRFGIDIDDTGGTPLRNSKPALFLRQIAKLLFEETPSNLTIATVLKNPLCHLSNTQSHSTKLARLFELTGLRGSICSPKSGNFHAFLAKRRAMHETAHYVSSHVKGLNDHDWDELLEYVQKLDEILQPLADLKEKNKTSSLADLMHLLFLAAQRLSVNENDFATLFTHEGADELQKLHTDIMATHAGSLTVELSEFPSVFDALLSSGTFRPRYAKNPRLHIYGPLEVRLLNHDRVILAGLNEGTWPQTSRNDAFLNRAMRQELGMASPERRTGLAAHDFQQLMGCDEVILSRSSRVDKAPTVASRWIQRFFTLIGETHYNALAERGRYYISLASHLDEAPRTQRIARPNPTPPVDARPTVLPVTAVETWIRDPYALYASRILDLKPLEPLAREPDPLLKGTLYHTIMEEYVTGNFLSLSQEERYSALINIADKFIDAENLPMETQKIWKLRFKEIAAHYITWESTYHEKYNVHQTFCEIKGSIPIGDNFTLTARADRIDLFEDGSINILDYKTGGSPSPKQARSLSPQLALEGLIAQRCGFQDTGNAILFDLVYMRLLQGENFNAERIAGRDHTVSSIIEKAAQELTKLVEGFKNPDQGYVSRRAPFKESEMSNDYDHLARTREWSFGEEGDADD